MAAFEFTIIPFHDSYFAKGCVFTKTKKPSIHTKGEKKSFLKDSFFICHLLIPDNVKKKLRPILLDEEAKRALYFEREKAVLENVQLS